MMLPTPCVLMSRSGSARSIGSQFTRLSLASNAAARAQASSATIPSKWRNVNERKCSDQQMPRTTYDTVKRILFSIQSFFKQFIKVKRVELNVRTDTAISAEVDILSNVKKVEVRCDKLASLM